MSDSEFHLHNSFVYWIVRLGSVIKEDFNQRLREEGVTWPQWMALNLLYHGEANTPARVADGVGVDRSAVTRLLDRLEAKALVQRHHHEGDRRSVRLRLTEAGRERAAGLNRLAAEHQAQFVEQLPVTERRIFKSNLQKLLRGGGVETLNLWR